MEPTQFDFIFEFYAKLLLIKFIHRGHFYLSAIIFDRWRLSYQNFELQGCVRKFVPSKSLHINEND
jgi:hypothetical protein